MYASLPLVIGGDFNLVRSSFERSSGNGNQMLMDRFNMFIDLHQLQEVRRHGPKFTWTNKQSIPVMVTLDRILVATKWEARHPLCSAWSRTRVRSDHWPIFLDSGEQDGKRLTKPFYLKKQWLLEDDFLDKFVQNWNKVKTRFSIHRYSLDTWHGCLKPI
jgi:hypothetical protein